jgi:hypothetical protein
VQHVITPIPRPVSYRRRLARTGVAALAFGFIVVGVATPQSPSEAASGSAVTVTAASQDADVANAPFPELSVTVSQTTDLQAQGILVSWTGAALSQAPTPQTGGANFLQIAQCWGDDPDHPGQPDRRTCQYGAIAAPGATRDSVRRDISGVAAEDLEYTVPGSGFASPTYTSIPFVARNNEEISSIGQQNGQNVALPVNVNSNKFFTKLTTNEIPWAGSASDGTGSAKFEVQTLAQSPGLGCGAAITGSDGTVTGASCWLVIIPRGETDAGEDAILRSGLFWDSWKHRVAIKLDFRPLGVRCDLGAAERQLAGSELIGAAVASWQPALCNAAGGSIYSAITGAESDAASSANGKTTAPLALTSRALSDGTTDSLKYAPVALTGLAIVFAIDRSPNPFKVVPPEIADRARLPIESMKLTPRLVAKLLTNSYLQSMPSGSDRSHLGFISNAEPGHNAQNLTTDPDFLAINDPEWAYEALSSPAVADLLVPQGRSDAAWAVWNYVLADAAALEFLRGTPDPWGMVVNPWNSIDATVNPSGTALALPRDNFPRSDPVEVPATADVGAVNLVTWRPYTSDFDTSAYLTLRGDGQVLGSWDLFSVPPKFTKTGRDLAGFQKVMGLTDTASAARYSVVTAALLNPAGNYVIPTSESLLAAAAAMTADAKQSQVFGFDPTSAPAKAAAQAYPLALPVFAAVSPKMTDSAVRASYAAFIRYASTTGQTPGQGLGQLPDGYAPIPASWRSLAATAASAIQSGPTAAAPSSPSSSGIAVGVRGSTDSSTASVPSPTPTGDAAGALAGPTTKADPDMTLISSTVPLVGLGVILALIAIPIMNRFRKPL